MKCLSALSLRVTPIPSRTTRKSYRPRASDRPMCCQPSNHSGLSASEPDRRRRHLIKMQREMEKENQGILEMIPPLRGGDFQGIAGLSSDDSLLVGVNSARAKFYEGPRAVKHRLDEPGQIIPQHGCVPALPASVSPGSGNFSPKINQGSQGQLRTKRLSSLTGGWKSRNSSPIPVLGEIFFLTFPFIDQANTFLTCEGHFE